MLALALLSLALQQQPGPPAAPDAPDAPAATPPAAPAPAPRPPPPPRAAPARPPRPGAEARPAQPEAKPPPVLTGFERRSGKRFSGDFDDADVGDAVGQIADAAGWSLVLPPGDRGTITARFKDVPVEDALRAVLAQAGLSAVLEGQIVTVRAGAAAPGQPSREVRRAEREARREAERAEREAEREQRRLEGELDEGSDKVVRGDVAVHAGQAARDVVAIGGTIKVDPGAEVRDAVAVLGSIVLEPGAVARQAVAVGGDVRLGAGAIVERDVVSVGGSVKRDPGAEIGGEEVSVGIPALSGLTGLAGSRLLGNDESAAFRVAQALAKFLVFFVLGLVVLTLFPRRLDVVAASFTANPWKSVFTGLLGIVVLPLVLLLLVATLIGIPLVPVAGLLVVAAGVLGFSALAWYIGRNLPLRTERGGNVLQLALGTAIVVLVTSIPLLGCMAFVAAALLTFGAVLRSRFGSQSPILPTSIPPPPAAPPPAPAA